MAMTEAHLLLCRRWRNFVCAKTLRCFSSSSFGTTGFFATGSTGGVPHVPVLIVGAGPVGLVLAMLLTKLGVKCVVLEKTMSFSQHPQAHFVNNRSMEIFRTLDGLADDIQKLQPPIELWRKFIYCTSLSGQVLGSVDHMRPQDFDKVISPISVAHFSQYKLTRLLLLKLQNLGFHVCTPTNLECLNTGLDQGKKILMGHEAISLSSTSEGVSVEASFTREGKTLKRDFHCSILIGSDGSRSTVRKLTGIGMKGERDIQQLISIHFFSKDLGQYLLQERPGMLFFVFNPEIIGVLVAHDLTGGEFVLQIPFYPPQQKLEEFSFEVCESIIYKLVGRKLLDICVLDVKPWVMHAEVAENYISHNDRVILVGDAAHHFPPAGGFGMNTGIQDVHNLAWKIASLSNGICSSAIFQTYETERRPIALSNTSLSITNFKAAMSVPAALGLDPSVANSVLRVINSRLGAIFPSALRKVALEGIFSIGRAQLSEILLNENNPLGASRLAKVKHVLDEGKSLQLQFPAQDIGFRYKKGALFPDLDNEHQDTPETVDACRNCSREYVPSSAPGSRLPHMVMKPLHTFSTKDVLSILDLISYDKLEWLFIIAPKKQSYDLASAALKVAELFKITLKVCVIWPQGTSNEHQNGSRTVWDSNVNFIDVEEVKSSSLPLSWWETCQMTNKGAILVRPDEHIAWRVQSAVVGDLDFEMKRVFSLIIREPYMEK